MKLEVREAVVRYGAITALHGVSFEVDEGEIVTLLGANGAGKTTTLRMLSGLHGVTSGQILFEGRDVTTTPAHEFISLGIGHVPPPHLPADDGGGEPGDGRLRAQGLLQR